MTPRLPTPRTSYRRAATLVTLTAGVLLLTACAPWRIWTSADLAKDAQAYSARPEQPTQRLLIVGDSTGVGTGASSPQDSLAGLIGQQHPQWRIDNLAANGAKFADVVQQLEGASSGYDMVLVLAGGNDVIRFTSQEALATQVKQTVAIAQRKAQTVVIMPSGNVGHAPFFWPPLSWVMSRRSENLHALVRSATEGGKARYISLLKPKEVDPFVTRSDELNAADGLHPSSAGYQEWHRELIRQGGFTPLAK